ncbi:hypothetical protein DFJ73DRAFT_932553 [Zopfochytrium polystomum]|nr:hypothetical protein DFJ73DRAFT_932553 [Zopfochytrium polystomum]
MSFLQIDADRGDTGGYALLTLWGRCVRSGEHEEDGLLCHAFSAREILSSDYTINPPSPQFNSSMADNITPSVIANALPQPTNPLAFFPLLVALPLALLTTLVTFLVVSSTHTKRRVTFVPIACTAALAATTAVLLALAVAFTARFATVMRDQVNTVYARSAVTASVTPWLLAALATATSLAAVAASLLAFAAGVASPSPAGHRTQRLASADDCGSSPSKPLPPQHNLASVQRPPPLLIVVEGDPSAPFTPPFSLSLALPFHTRPSTPSSSASRSPRSIFLTASLPAPVPRARPSIASSASTGSDAAAWTARPASWDPRVVVEEDEEGSGRRSVWRRVERRRRRGG